MGIVAVIGERYYGNTAAGHEYSSYFEIARLHEGHEVLHDDVHAVFVEVAVVAEAEEVELEALALDHEAVGDVVDDYLAEVGLVSLGAERSELRAGECDKIVVLRMLVFESFEHLRSVVGGILDSGCSEEGAACKFI